MLRSIPTLAFAALLLTACGGKKAAPAAEEEHHNPDLVMLSEAQYKSAGVVTGSITYANLSSYVRASGNIEVPPQDLISVTLPYGGTLRYTNVIEGRYVKKGALIATIENPEFVQVQQDYLESSSQLSYLRQNLSRQEELVRENIAARKSLQQAQSDYNSMVARVEGLKARLRIFNIDPASVRSGNVSSKANIYAPSDGYITHVYSNVGRYIGANEPLADMANTANILVRIKVFEKDLSKIKPGQPIRFQATGDSTERKAEVLLIGKDIDTDRTVEVHGRIINASPHLIPGLFVTALVETGSAAAPALPEEAIVQSGGRQFIFVVEDANGKGQRSVFRRMEVTTGTTENGYTAVTLPPDFDPKRKVVLKGAYDLLSKMTNVEEEE